MRPKLPGRPHENLPGGPDVSTVRWDDGVGVLCLAIPACLLVTDDEKQQQPTVLPGSRHESFDVTDSLRSAVRFAVKTISAGIHHGLWHNGH